MHRDDYLPVVKHTTAITGARLPAYKYPKLAMLDISSVSSIHGTIGGMNTHLGRSEIESALSAHIIRMSLLFGDLLCLCL